MTPRTAAHLFLGLLWAQLALALFPSWQDGTYYSYGWLVLAACLYFYALRRRDFPLSWRAGTRIGVTAVLAFLVVAILAIAVLRLFQGANPYWRLLLWTQTLLTLLATVALLVFGQGPRVLLHHLPALILIVAAVPLPSSVERSLVQNLTHSVVLLSSDLARGSGIPMDVTGTAFIIRGKPLDVNDRCSGIRSFQSSLAVALLVGELLRLQAPARLLLLALGALASFAGNTFRVLSLVEAYFKGGLEHLEDRHDSAGMLSITLTYGFILAVGFLLERGITKTRKGDGGPRKIQTPDLRTPEPRNGSITPALLLLSVLLAGGEIARHWWLNPSETQWGSIVMPTLDVPAMEKGGSLLSRPVNNVDTGALRFDEAAYLQGKHEHGDPLAVLFLTYRPNNRSLWTDLFTHPPEVCMRSSGCALEETLPARALDLGDQSVPVRILKYREPSNGSSLFIFKTIWLPPGSPIQPGENMADLRALWVSMALNRIPHPPGAVLLAGIWGVEQADTAWAIFQHSVVPHVRLASAR